MVAFFRSDIILLVAKQASTVCTIMRRRWHAAVRLIIKQIVVPYIIYEGRLTSSCTVTHCVKQANQKPGPSLSTADVCLHMLNFNI